MESPASLAEMRRLVVGFSVSIAISAVAELGIADRLAAGAQTVGDLAKATGVNEAFLRRVLRYLASEGIFDEEDGDRFALNQRSHWLRSDVAGSVRPRAVFSGTIMSWAAWGGLPRSLRSGASGIEEAFGQTLFEYANAHPDAGAAFNTFMADQTAASVEAILGAISFAGVEELVDVGGGRGALVAGVLRAYPDLRGILFDLPEVIANAGPLLDGAGVADRCRPVGGSFFEAVPTGGDLYLLKFILHDWPDQDCVRILSNCRRAIRAGGRLFVVEHLITDRPGPDFARVMDVTMLVMSPGGRERTREEFVQLFGASGFELRQVLPTAIGISLLECVTSPTST
jgi:hypothetical protein